MIVRAKVRCSGVTKQTHWNKAGEFLYKATFQVVSGTSEENAKFFEATPGGQLELSTLRDDFFTPGKEYYVDLTEA